MRYKSLWVCGIALIVFLGLGAAARYAHSGESVAAPSTPQEATIQLADDAADPSIGRLASIASIVAGVLAFTVLPGRGKRSILFSESAPAGRDGHHRARHRGIHRSFRHRRPATIQRRAPRSRTVRSELLLR